MKANRQQLVQSEAMAFGHGAGIHFMVNTPVCNRNLDKTIYPKEVSG